MADKKKAPAAPYEHQEFPKVMYSGDGSQVLIKDQDHYDRFMAKTKKEWADTPADFYEDGENDPRHPKFGADPVDSDDELAAEEGEEGEEGEGGKKPKGKKKSK